MRLHRDTLWAAGLLAALLLLLGAIWLPYIPNELGHASADYAFWLPNLLAGYFWYLHNGLFALPWFTPAECAGAPFQADPQIGYWSLPQILSFMTDPLSAVRISLFAYGAAGYWGAWLLARRSFQVSLPAALLAAGLFLLNGFFSARMAVGHLAFAPFMLLPAVCAVLLRAPGASAISRPALVLRAVLCGVLLATLIQSGMVILLPQFFLAVAAVVLLHAVLFGWARGIFSIAYGGLALGLALCAGKLAASAALLSHFPRQNYPLPGLPGIFGTAYVALRSLFWPFSTDLGGWIVHSRLIQDPHEFAYGVGLAPPLLLLAALVLTWRQGGWRALAPRRRGLAAALALALLMPLALNFYAPGWTALLKSLPILSSSSTLLRWFAVLMLPAILGAALALDRLAAAMDGRGMPAGCWLLAAAGLVLTVGGVAGADRTAFGSAGLGMYDPTDITQAWQQAHDSGNPKPIKAVAQLFNGDHKVLMIPDRQNGMAHGLSTLSCYDPLFGYRLENLPFGKIRLGLALNEQDGVLNFKNPACYVFPGANSCAPGDQFTPALAEALQQFLNYESYDFKKPRLARLADWLSLLTLLSLPGLAGWCVWRMRRAKAEP